MSIVRKTVRALRALSLQSEPGTFLGTEPDLLALLKISRPTFRQATIVLEQEQILAIKRGVGGGYFSKRPTSDAVTRIAAVYFQSQAVTLTQIMRAIVPIWIKQVSAAAQSEDDAGHDFLRELFERDDSRSAEHLDKGQYNADEYLAFLRSERDFTAAISHLAGDPVFSLFEEILNDFCAQLPPNRDIFRLDTRRVSEYSNARRRVIEAILDRDERMAALCADRCWQLQLRWIEEEEGDHHAPAPTEDATDLIEDIKSSPAKQRSQRKKKIAR